jgi:outer membrane murein-binding lipoprotein Lpp
MIVNNSDWGARAMTQDEELQLEEIAIQVVELPAAFADLEVCINRAASELEGQGEKSNRIARQLLTALARFHGECGT